MELTCQASLGEWIVVGWTYRPVYCRVTGENRHQQVRGKGGGLGQCGVQLPPLRGHHGGRLP